MPEPSDANLRAILVVLLRRLGGTVEIGNEELYDAMLSDRGVRTGHFIVEDVAGGVVVTVVRDHDADGP